MPPNRRPRTHRRQRGGWKDYIDGIKHSLRMNHLTSLISIDQDQDGDAPGESQPSVQLRLLRHCLGLEKNNCVKFLNDAMLVCIHIMLSPRESSCVYEIGISTLDVQAIESLSNTATPSEIQGLVTTYNYRTPAHVINGRNFIFGISEPASVEYLTLLLKKVLLTGSPLATTQELKDVVLVSYDIYSKMFDLLRMQICERDTMKNLYTIDARQLGTEVFGEQLSLKVLLKSLRIPFGGLQNGGNYSNFTLKALIMLARCNYDTNSLLLEEELDRYQRLEAMAIESHDRIDEKLLVILNKSKGSEVARSANLDELQAFSNTYDFVLAQQMDGLTSAMKVALEEKSANQVEENPSHFTSLRKEYPTSQEESGKNKISTEGSNQLLEDRSEKLEIKARELLFGAEKDSVVDKSPDWRKSS